MDIAPLFILLLMGIVISCTSGRFTGEADADRADINPISDDDSNDGSEDQLQSNITSAGGKHHISYNSHLPQKPQILRRLSQAAFADASSTGPNKASLVACNHQHHSRLHPHYAFLHQSYLRRVMLTNTSVTCNDGTKAGYYLRQSFGSRRWIIFLEGGWYCFNTISCHQRWLRMRHLMTSAHWPEARNVGGILSSNPEENPHWWNANHVFIPYCSSDTWSGSSPASSPGDLSFLGARIIEQVIIELLPRGLFDAKMLILAGSSAGAAGVLVNLDRIADLLHNLGSQVQVRGLADSGWFLDNEPFDFATAEAESDLTPAATAASASAAESDNNNDDNVAATSNIRKQQAKQARHQQKKLTCTDAHNCAPLEAIKQGINLWNGQVPESCRAHYQSEPWRCYFGYRLYPTLKTPVFVFQYLFDVAQMTVDNVREPFTKAQWKYVQNLEAQLRSTLENATAVFAPSCISHTIITKSDWQSVRINRISLPQALRCWELQTIERNHYQDYSSDSSPPHSENVPSTTEADLLADSPTHNQAIQGFLRLMNKLNNNNASSANINYHPAKITVEKIRKKKRKRKQRRRNHPGSHQHHHTSQGHHHRSSDSLKSKRGAPGHRFHHDRHRWLQHEDLCHHWLVDSCSWPQCNPACPPLHSPFAGN